MEGGAKKHTRVLGAVSERDPEGIGVDVADEYEFPLWMMGKTCRLLSPAASAVETLNPAKEESEISAAAPAARRSASRRETLSEGLLMPGGRLILFIRAKSTPDCRIRK